MKNIFVFDENKCVACHACAVACMLENGIQENGLWRKLKYNDQQHRPNLPLFYLSMACNHCEDAPCMKNCPALAYHKDQTTGAILHNADKCIGCKYCTWTCPFDAPVFNRQRGIIEKCTFCNHRLEEGDVPACALSCPTGALAFQQKEFSREESRNSSPIPVDVGTQIEIIKLRNQDPPEIDASLFDGQEMSYEVPQCEAKISAKKELPLLLFTLISAGMVALYISGHTTHFNLAAKIGFLFIGLFSGLLSLFHLGRKGQAWRSLLNIQNSWLSREILFYTLFYGTVSFDFFVHPIPWLVSAIPGILFLFSIDMVYLPAQWQWKTRVHSALTLIIMLHSLFLLNSWVVLFTVFAILRILLFFYQNNRQIREKFIPVIIRVSTITFATILIHLTDSIALPIIVYVVGEIIDRIEFYNELKTPEWELQR
ncbi:MAG: 4Fe-4S binding protein [Bacteroidales bacterium]|nr:4Fe-4S binding protein [Bacteroidales bacterium]MCF8456942.1 4Fe-4S binding protein [Bacteroidales bacterium]